MEYNTGTESNDIEYIVSIITRIELSIPFEKESDIDNKIEIPPSETPYQTLVNELSKTLYQTPVNELSETLY